MKHKLLLTLGIAVMALVGCRQDVDVIIPEVSKAEGALAIKIEGRIDQEYATRVDDGGFTDGDQIGLYGVNYTDNNATAGELLDKGNQVDNARYTYDGTTWSSSGNIYYKDAETNIDLYAYYPYGSVNSVSEYAFEVEQDQSGGNAVDGYAMSDFLWSKTENVTPSENKVKIKFNHKMACANVILTEGDGFESGEFDMLEKFVLVMNTTRTSTIDISTGKVTATGKAAREGIVMKSGAEGFRAIVVPQSVDAGQTLFSITINGIPYTYKYKVQNELNEWIPASFTYEAGKLTKFEIKINKKEHSGEYEFILTDTEIVDWIADLDSNGGEARQYYVVHCDEPGTLEAKILADGKNPAKIKNLKVSGKINACDFSFMNSKMEILEAVNLRECKLIKSSDEEIDDMIPSGAFSDKKSLYYFTFPEKVVEIGSNAFSNSSLSGALLIPDQTKSIGSSAFENTNISSVEFSHILESIGSSAFEDCGSISGILNLPTSLTKIGSRAFYGCKFTGELILPNNLESIGEAAFCNAGPFSGNLRIPDKITELEASVFLSAGFTGSLDLNNVTKLNSTRNSDSYGGCFSNCGFQGELIIPEGLSIISFMSFNGNLFNSIKFPTSLRTIEEDAFRDCRRLTGTLEFHEGLVIIEERAFHGCSTLLNIVLPSSLQTIQSNAFSACYYLNNIICKAIEPPYVQSGVFNGVAKDNFAVEVPEQSVNRYQNSSGWNEFKRIVAHHDFTISRRLMRTLNAEHTREFVLRAPSGFAWSVESMPDWVTVTPSSGVGKTEVTVTVAEMTAAEVGEFEINIGSYNNPQYEYNRGRAGEIVFLLDGKDYRATMNVEQYDYQYGDGDVIVNQSATKGGGVNLVFMGDCFDARDIAKGSYLEGINEAIGYYFDIEPYKTYRDYFNVYTIVGMSNDSGMGTVNTIRDAKFGSQYSLEGITPNHETTYEYAMKPTTVNEDNLGQTLVVMIENTTEYGGICYMWGDGSAIACCPMSDDAFPYDFRGIVQHEAGGHGFGKLADEYIYTNAFISACVCPNPHLSEFYAGKSLGWYRNLEDTGDMDQVGWSHLIFHPTYSNIVDIYEGGYFHTRGIFRSEPNSCMNNNIPYYSAISRQEMVERIMRYAGEEFSLDDFYANDVLDTYGNTATRSAIDESLVISSGAGKQMPPRFMGDKPQLKKNNK